MARVSLLELQVLQPRFRGSPVPCLDQVARNVDPRDVCSHLGQW